MKITILSSNFYPEETSTGLYTGQMAVDLSKKNEVSVITGFPYYPKWEIFDSYKKKPFLYKENLDNIKIHRCKLYVPKKPGFFKRIISIISFSIGSLFNIFKLKSRPDVVFAVVPFTSTAFLAYLMKLFYGCKVWVHVQDFEFDAAIDSGIVSNKKWFLSILFKLERFLLNKADIVSTISASMINKMSSKTNTSVYFLPNWIDTGFFNDISPVKHKLLNNDKFNVLYSGNIGEKQDWDMFVKVVELFQDNNGVLFTVVGGGAKKEWLLEKVKGLNNVKIYDPVDYNEVPQLLSSADVHILFQKNDIVESVMPSKLLGMIASGIPSIVTGNQNSEIKKILVDSQGGIYISKDIANEVKNSIINYKSSTDKSKIITAPQYIFNHFSREEIINKLNEKLKNI